MEFRLTSPFLEKVKISGMTLVELMFVLAIIGILVAIVFPSFQQQIRESRRGDGITQLMRLKIQQEAYRLEHPTYASTKQLSLPESSYFTFSVKDHTSTTYTLIAAAIGSQKQDYTCKIMSIDQSMRRKPEGCWH